MIVNDPAHTPFKLNGDYPMSGQRSYYLNFGKLQGQGWHSRATNQDSNSAAEQTGRRDYMASKVDWQLSGCDCIVVVEFVHTTSVLCTVNYEPCTIRHKFKSMGNKVDVM